MLSRLRANAPYALIAAAVLALDIWVKHIAEDMFVTRGRWEAYPLIPKVLRMVYTENRGAAFGIFENARWFFLILGAVVLTAIICFVFLRRSFGDSKALLACGAVVFAGAAGNLVDRVIHDGGYVIDMFEFVFVRFAIFNVADIALTCGGAAFCLAYLLGGRPKPVAIPAENDAENDG